MLTKDDFYYDLPQELIAQEPLLRRDSSRLLVFHRNDNRLEHKKFVDIVEYFQAGDILVVNNSRVIPARLIGKKAATGGRVEILLLDRLSSRSWRVLAGGKRLIPELRFQLLDRNDGPSGIFGTVISELEGALRIVEFDHPAEEFLPTLGRTPLPPYIHEPLKDPERYQTVYSQPLGSAAAPTAGLHFSPDVLLALRDRGVLIETITLHVGLDTFKPVSATMISDHTIHSEWASLSAQTAKNINNAKLAGRSIWAVGTTSVRVLETAALRSAGATGSLSKISLLDSAANDSEACAWRAVSAFEGSTDLFIYPGYKFRAVDKMLTNFHLPSSSLIMLVAAFAGRDRILQTYNAAIEDKYRFYSFGDAMLIL